MSQKQAKRLRRLEKDVEIVRDGLKEVMCGECGQEVRLSNAESGLKDQSARLTAAENGLVQQNLRLKSLEGGLDGFQQYLFEVKDEDLEKAHADRRAASRRATDAEHALTLWKAVSFGAITAAVVIALAAATAVAARGQDIQPEQTLPPEPPAIIRTIQAVQNAPDAPEENENERIEAALLARAHKLEDVRVTYYDAHCVQCCGKTDGVTASDLQATPYVSAAVDPAVIPLGADLLVDYGDGILHYLRADDTGAAITGIRIDICVASHAEALWLGVDRADVYWVEG